MSPGIKQTEKRKRDHLEPFREGGVSARRATTWFECLSFVHCALPELDIDELDLSTSFADHRFRAPLFITGMTGGTPEAGRINRSLAKAAERMGIGFGLGSQRAMLESPELADSYRVRDVAPTVFLAGNLGGAQVAETAVEKIQGLLDDVSADALCVHLNPAQELMQPEGDRRFRGVLRAIGALAGALDRPVIVKEVGAGISREVGLRLRDVGISHIDLAGSGGTSWVGVELKRRGAEEDPNLAAFWDWGVPTAAAVADLADCGLQLIASGGIRTGLDVARALALGATLAGVASPVIQAYFREGETACQRALESIIDGLRTAMLLTGSRTLDELRRAPRVISDPLLNWSRQRGRREEKTTKLSNDLRE